MAELAATEMKPFPRLDQLHSPAPAWTRPSHPGTLPFDQEQRYRSIGALLRALRADGAPLRVLDVGGRTAALRQHLAPDDTVVLVDPERSDERGLVLGCGEALPFATGAFDAVVAADTLEHVPEPLRGTFVSECCRVTRSWTLLAGPYHHPRVAEAEERLVEFVRARIGSPHRYLEEHRALGLPHRDRVEAWCRLAGAREVRSVGHGNLERWLGLMCITLLLDRDPATRAAAQRLHQFYNQALLPDDRAGHVYRHVVIAVKDGPLPPSAEELLAPADIDEEHETAVRHALDQLLTFDQQRDVLHEERARLEGEIARRDADLLGHARALEEARGEASEQRGVLEDLLLDLDGHREALLARDEELAAVKADLARVVDEAREIEEALLRKTRWRRRLRGAALRLFGCAG